MARQFTAGTVPANLIAAHNETHRSVVGLEAAKPHYDAAEWDPNGLEQVLGTFFSSPSVMADAINVVEKAIVLYDDHVSRHNGGTGKKIYAHKITSSAIGGTPSSAGAALEQAMVDAWGPICLSLLTTLRDHMLNTGGTWHATADTFNSVGTLPASITTKASLCEWIIILRSVYEAHRVYGAGVQHTLADAVNTVAAAPPDNSDDWDGMLAVLIEMADELEDHVEDASYHNAVMAITPTVAAFPVAVTTAFGRANTYKSTHNTHLGSAAIHEAADAANTIAAADATTVATLVALAQEIFTDQPAHFRNAPITSAMRSL